MHWCCKGLLLNRVRFQPLNIDVVLGAFNNYVDQILSNFDHLPPSSRQMWTFYIIPTLCSRDQVLTFYCPLPTFCPHSYWMPPFSAFEIRDVTIFWVFRFPEWHKFPCPIAMKHPKCALLSWVARLVTSRECLSSRWEPFIRTGLLSF